MSAGHSPATAFADSANDPAIAQALLTTIRPGFSVVTVRLDTNYFGAVRGGRIVASARVVRKGKRIAHGEAVVTDEAIIYGCRGCDQDLILPFAVVRRGKAALLEYLSKLPPRRKRFGPRRKGRPKE